MSEDSENGAAPNLVGATTKAELISKENMLVARRMAELDAEPIQGNFDYAHLQAIHRHLFQDVYEWAGQERTTPAVKYEAVLGGALSGYAEPEDIRETFEEGLATLRDLQMTDLRDPEQAAQFAQGFRRVWEAHPFPDGNTRSTTMFIEHLATERGQQLEFQGKEDGSLRNALVYHWYDSDEYAGPLETRVQQARDVALRNEAVRDQNQDALQRVDPDVSPPETPSPARDPEPDRGQEDEPPESEFEP